MRKKKNRCFSIDSKFKDDSIVLRRILDAAGCIPVYCAGKYSWCKFDICGWWSIR